MAETPLVRTSERNDFKRCPWMWYHSWVLGLTTRRNPTWAWFGTAIHAALEVRYKKGNKRGSLKKMLEAFDECLDGEIRRIYTDGGEIEDDEVVDARTLGHAMLRGYVEEYGDEPDVEVIHSEQSFQISVPHPTKEGKWLAVYCGTWDSLWRLKSTGEFWLVDHKTRRSFPQNWSFYNINDQAGSYLWVAPEVLVQMGVLKKSDKIEGIIFNALRKHMPDTRPVGPDGLRRNKPLREHYLEALGPMFDIPGHNVAGKLPTVAALAAKAEQEKIQVWGEVSKVQPAPLYHREYIERYQRERVTQGQRVQQELLHMDLIRKGKMQPYKTPTEDCVRCKLFEFCEADEQNPEEGSELAKAILMHRDPYADHREAMLRGGVEINGTIGN
jgi:hypothetical protein